MNNKLNYRKIKYKFNWINKKMIILHRYNK